MKINSVLQKMPEKGVALFILALGVIISVGVILVSCEAAKSEISSVAYTQEELLQRGQYLVSTSACHDCHSPKVMTSHGFEPDPERLLSGHPADLPIPSVNQEALKDWILFNPHLTAIAGPWGVSFAANITSDETGIGNWTEEQFLRAIREGTYKGLKGGRPLLPPMPWPVYRNMTDNDLKAIFAYLKSTKPVRNVVPAPIAPR
jgi:hypothetical protein